MPLDVELAEIRDFLATHAPFDSLPPHVLTSLPARLDLEYRRRGSRILAAGQQPSELLVVRSGAVEVLDGEGRLAERGAAGTCIGGGALAAGVPQPGDVTALEDTLLLVMPAPVFDELRADHRIVATYFADDPGERLRQLAARRREEDAEAGRGRAVLRARAEDLVTGPPVSVPTSATIRDAARVMAEHRISSVLVTDGPRLAGIVTDRDLRSRVLAAGVDPERPVSDVMTADPVTEAPGALAVEVLLEMVRRNIHHLPLVADGEPVGLVTATDLLRLERANPVHLVGEVATAADVEEVAAAASRTGQVVESLIRHGTSARDIGQIVTSVGDAVERRLLQLAEADLGPPPVPYAWLTLGSRARHEQALGPDQDHALVLHDDYRPAEHECWFAALAEQVTAGLETSGYPRCRGEKMATNPQWRVPLTTWRALVSGWVREPGPAALLESSVFFDLRHSHGDETLTADLRRHQREAARSSPLFLALLAAQAAGLRPPLGFFRGLVVDRSGEHRDTLDLKKRGILIVVELARVHGLAAGSEATSTVARLADAVRDQRISPELAADLEDAWEFLSQLRLRHQAQQVRSGDRPDSRIAPALLSSLEKQHLKATFGVLRSAQTALAQRYPVRELT